jgi:hypothetical protein
MKIKTEEYGLISIKWIDDRIKQCLIDKNQAGMGEILRIGAEVMLLEEIKHQLLSAREFASSCYEKGSGGYDPELDGSRESYDRAKQKFLDSEFQM